MSGFKGLEVYKEAKRLALEIHRMTLSLPKFELYEQGSQIRRSSKAIVVAIVEGYSRRRYKNDFIRFLVYSQAECDETLEHLDLLYHTGSLTDETVYKNLYIRYDALSKRINKFIQWVELNWSGMTNVEKHETSV